MASSPSQGGSSGATTTAASKPSGQLAPFSIERLLAAILVRLETRYNDFCRRGWRGELAAAYQQHWLHSDQVITLEAEGGAKARVRGVTADWGMLEVAELGWDGRETGRVWELQSDENSFDFWKGLVRRKK